MYKEKKQFAYIGDESVYLRKFPPADDDDSNIVTDNRVDIGFDHRQRFETYHPSGLFDWCFPNLHLYPDTHEITVNTPLALKLFGMGCRKVMGADTQTYTVRELRVFRKMAFFSLTKDNPISIVKFEAIYFPLYEGSLPKQESPIVAPEAKDHLLTHGVGKDIVIPRVRLSDEENEKLMDDHLLEFSASTAKATIEKEEMLLFLNSYDEDLNSGLEKYDEIIALHQERLLKQLELAEFQRIEKDRIDKEETLLFLSSFSEDLYDGSEKFDDYLRCEAEKASKLRLIEKSRLFEGEDFEEEKLMSQLDKNGVDACEIAEIRGRINSKLFVEPVSACRQYSANEFDDYDLFIMNVMEAKVSMQVEKDLLSLLDQKCVSKVLLDRDKIEKLSMVHDVHHEIKTNLRMRMCEMVSFFFFFRKGRVLSRLNKKHRQYRTITPIRDLDFVSANMTTWGDFKWLLYLVQRSRATIVYDPGSCVYPQIKSLDSCNKMVRGRRKFDYCPDFAFSSHFVKSVGMSCPNYYGTKRKAIKHFHFDKVRVVSVHSHYVYESELGNTFGSLWRLVARGAFDVDIRDQSNVPSATDKPIKINIIKNLRVKDVD